MQWVIVGRFEGSVQVEKQSGDRGGYFPSGRLSSPGFWGESIVGAAMPNVIAHLRRSENQDVGGKITQ